MRELIRGKTICDVGCAKGDMVMQFSRFAAYAFGINDNKEEVDIARGREVDVLYGDALKMDIPAAHFYFFYWDETVGSPFIQRMMDSQPGPFTILTSGYEGKGWQNIYINDWNPSTVYTFPYIESGTVKEELAPAEGTWWLVAIEKP